MAELKLGKYYFKKQGQNKKPISLYTHHLRVENTKCPIVFHPIQIHLPISHWSIKKNTCH